MLPSEEKTGKKPKQHRSSTMFTTKTVSRLGKNIKHDVYVAIDNSVKTMNNGHDTDRYTVDAYAMVYGVIKVTDSEVEYNGWADLVIYEVDKGVFVALPNMYQDEDGFELTASDGSIWTYSAGEVFTNVD